ncbi:MAG: hypothetical protein MRY32_04365 [Rickettsiales bacterium]|nr:hypothetical protein [Rickettsiales bacterium]
MGFRDYTAAVRPKAGETTQHIVVMRENHFDDSTAKMLRENVELTRGATVSLELPYVAFNPIFTAHRNRAITDEQLLEFFSDYARHEEKTLSGEMREFYIQHGVTLQDRIGAYMEKAYMAIALHNRQPPVPVVAHDTRGTPYLHHHQLGINKKYPPEMQQALLLSRQMGERFPESLKYVPFIAASQKDGIPDDVTSATIASDMIGKNGYGIVNIGALHASGIPIKAYKSQGTFDETLQRQGAKVVDTMIAAHPDFLKMTVALEKQAITEYVLESAGEPDQSKRHPLSHDRLDYLYFFVQGQLHSGTDIQRNGYYDPVITDGQPRHPNAGHQLYGKSASDAWGASVLENQQGRQFIEAVNRFIESQPKGTNVKIELDNASNEYGAKVVLPEGKTALSTPPIARDKGGGVSGPQ